MQLALALSLCKLESGSPRVVTDGLQALYEPERDAVAIDSTTSTLPDHSGNGYNMTLDVASTIIAGPGGKKAVRLPHTTTGTIANIPVDYRSFSIVVVLSHNTQSSFWEFLGLHVQFSPSILSGMPVFFSGSAVGPTSDPNPRSSPDDYTFFALTSSATQTKNWVNNRSLTAGTVSAGTGTGLTFSHNIGGDAIYKYAGIYIWNRPITDLEVAQMRTYALSILKTPETPSLSIPLVVAEGDSLTHGINDNHNVWPLQLVSLSPVNCLNRAQNSSTFAHLTDRAVDVVDNLYNVNRNKNIFIGLCGTNNLGSLGQTAAQVYSASQTYYQARVNAGFTTIIIGLPARGDSVQDTDGVNALWRADFGVATGITRVFAANGGITYAHYFLDIGADARFQDPNNVTYYQADKLHFTNASQTIIADEYVESIVDLII